jgi:hypothetical protein
MKTLLFLLLSALVFNSCHKNDVPGCPLTSSSIAGIYHLTKVEEVLNPSGIATDLTSGISNCERTAIYTFKADGTATYTLNSGCNGQGTGAWRIDEGRFSASLASGNEWRINSTAFVSWDCNHLVLITLYPTSVSNNRYTLTKN